VTRAPVPSRLRLRRRLLTVSAPVTVAALAVAVKLISVVVVGSSAQQHFAAGEIGSLRTDVAILQIVNVIEPANAAFAAGGLGVLEDQLEVADAEFSESLAHTDSAHSCAVRVNLELVREHRGDIDAWEARLDTARQRMLRRQRRSRRSAACCPAGCRRAGHRQDQCSRHHRATAPDAVITTACRCGSTCGSGDHGAGADRAAGIPSTRSHGRRSTRCPAPGVA